MRLKPLRIDLFDAIMILENVAELDRNQPEKNRSTNRQQQPKFKPILLQKKHNRPTNRSAWLCLQTRKEKTSCKIQMLHTHFFITPAASTGEV